MHSVLGNWCQLNIYTERSVPEVSFGPDLACYHVNLFMVKEAGEAPYFYTIMTMTGFMKAKAFCRYCKTPFHFKKDKDTHECDDNSTPSDHSYAIGTQSQ